MNVYKLAKYVRNCVVFWKIYTANKNFTRPPVATVATNFKSVKKKMATCSDVKGHNWRPALLLPFPKRPDNECFVCVCASLYSSSPSQ